MKVAFHFNADHESLRGMLYCFSVQKSIFVILLRKRNLVLSSKILTGDLLLDSLATDKKETGTGYALCFNKEKYQKVVQMWLRPKHTVWSSKIYDKLQEAITRNIYVVCFETLEEALMEHLDEELVRTVPAYLGAMEVDDASYIHWQLYSNSIGPTYRLINRRLTIFWDGISEDSKDTGRAQSLGELGFEGDIGFESLNGRYTIFDEYHDFEHARRIAEWKKGFGGLLAFIADNVVHRLSDAAPDLGDKLWSILRTFEDAETNEQLAQVTASCRRIVEYVSDQLFLPTDEEIDGHKLDTNHYKNRLLAFADKQKRSNTNINLVLFSTKTLNEEIEKLSKLANKGVHAEVYRAETRRCFLRTILLLDDIIALRPGAFEIKNKLNLDDLLKHLSQE